MTPDISPEMREAGRGYEALFVPSMMGVWAPRILDAASVGRGDDVIDIACGTGIVARRARERTGPKARITGADPTPGMIAVASEIAPRIEWILAPADAVPLAGDSFDCALCQFGMMFFPDRDAALAEMHRLVRPGGRLAIAVWNDLDHNPASKALYDFVADRVGPEGARASFAPFCLGDPADVAGPIQSAGFDDIRVETGTAPARFPSARVMVEAELRGWLPICGVTLPDDRIESLLDQSETVFADHLAADGTVQFQSSAHVISARKPE